MPASKSGGGAHRFNQPPEGSKGMGGEIKWKNTNKNEVSRLKVSLYNFQLTLLNIPYNSLELLRKRKLAEEATHRM
jgi:hypothetical protein